MLEQILESCLKTLKKYSLSQIYVQKPSGFKIKLRDDKEFNHTVHADIFYIDAKHILHAVNKATRFQSAPLLPEVTSKTLWNALPMCWTDVYLRPPDFIVHDAGKLL